MNIYAIREDNGERVLVAIRCDGVGCDAEIKPNPNIAKSGWTTTGVNCSGHPDKSHRWDWCPLCKPNE